MPLRFAESTKIEYFRSDMAEKTRLNTVNQSRHVFHLPPIQAKRMLEPQIFLLSEVRVKSYWGLWTGWVLRLQVNLDSKFSLTRGL